MRIQQIVENSTTAGSVATLAQPLMTQTRESVDVPGLKPVQQVMRGKAKKKGPYANSISEGKVKELHKDLKDLTSHQFQEKYKQSKADVRADMKNVNEDDLSEQDLIVIPGQGRLRGTGFTKHDPDRAEHEGQTLKNSLHTIIRLATHLDKELTVRDNFPEWVSEKVGSIKGDMLAVMNYIISSQEMQHDPDAMNEGSERVDSIVTDALKRMKGPDVSDAVLALKRVLGDRAYNERRGFYSFYVDQIHKMYNQQGVTEVAYRADLPNDQGRYTNDTTPSIGGVNMNRIKVGDIVNYFGEKVEVLDLGNGQARVTGGGKTMNVPLSKLKQYGQGMKEGKIDFAKKLQKNVDKHNKAVVKTKKEIGSRVADIGPGGKEHNEKTDAAWDAAKKKVSEGSNK